MIVPDPHPAWRSSRWESNGIDTTHFAMSLIEKRLQDICLRYLGRPISAVPSEQSVDPEIAGIDSGCRAVSAGRRRGRWD